MGRGRKRNLILTAVSSRPGFSQGVLETLSPSALIFLQTGSEPNYDLFFSKYWFFFFLFFLKVFINLDF